MAAKFAFVFVVIIALFQFVSWGIASPRTARDTTAADDATKSIGDAVNNLKSGLEDLMKKLQENELFQNLTTTVQQFSQSVQDQGKVLVEKIQKSTT